MSTEREPLMTDDWIEKHELTKPLRDQHPELAVALHVGMRVMRSQYESLIKEGGLREAKKVEFRTNDYDCYMECSACNWHICWQYVEDNPMRFCPGCGNPIDTDTGDIPLGEQQRP